MTKTKDSKAPSSCIEIEGIEYAISTNQLRNQLTYEQRTGKALLTTLQKPYLSDIADIHAACLSPEISGPALLDAYIADYTLMDYMTEQLNPTEKK